jgi:hypothetical protein
VPSLAQAIRSSRAAKLAARQGRSRAKALRASLRAARLAGRKLVGQSGDLRASLAAARLIAKSRAPG